MKGGGSIVTLDFDNQNQAWPIYDWMGVCKAGLQGATVRYLARDLGPHQIRVNAVAASPRWPPSPPRASRGSRQLERGWSAQAPLGWDSKNSHHAVAKTAVALISDFFPATTGEVIHVDGGYHAMGTDLLSKEEQARLAAEDG